MNYNNVNKKNINKHKIRTYFIVFSILILAMTFLGIYIYKWEFREPLLEMHFFSLNRGRAIFIRTPENKTILIGGGQNSELIREITKVTPFYSRKIDYMIIPSATPAQIGGFIEIIDRYSVGEIIMPKTMATSTVLTQLLKKIHKNKIHIEEVEEGDEVAIEKDNSIDMKNKITSDESITFKVLFPNKDFKYNKTSLPELGLLTSYKNTNAYLLGNLSKTIQKYILKNLAKDMEVIGMQNSKSEDIVEYYHSMSKTKLSDELFEFINPKYIFSTKEKTMYLKSDGDRWYKKL